ncbi:hypothetical protein PVK06_009087 [Gossypium arboreum]|uniref:Uncharacterized protein n=1 Tax=Gossypium arboreum TaxID=29729 RepID=A0ABR0QMD7_GOSAR|nr:hypothetical protein PVK06_009087 [Gossypium arboreum]
MSDNTNNVVDQEVHIGDESTGQFDEFESVTLSVCIDGVRRPNVNSSPNEGQSDNDVLRVIAESL